MYIAAACVVAAYLYPSEEARLMAHAAAPLCYRVLWGFLIREGCRLGEALDLRWSQLDLERGSIRLLHRKTGSNGRWLLDRGVVAALRAWRKPLSKISDRYVKGEHLPHPWVCLLCKGLIVLIGKNTNDRLN